MDFKPAYLGLHEEGLLVDRAQRAVDLLADCRLCARHCRVDRLARDTGVCRAGGRGQARVSSAFSHHGEEEMIRGTQGSGTIFMAGCSLHCEFCQNFDISHHDTGRVRQAGELADLMTGLAGAGCHNLNFVTPSHYTAQLLEGLLAFVEIDQGPKPPVVWNCGGYESRESLELLDGVVDIYMPDFKFLDSEASKRYLAAPDYPERAREGLLEMFRQVGPVRFSARGILERGVLIRHLVMPGYPADSRSILDFISSRFGSQVAVNVMGQYRPCGNAGKYSEIDRPLDYSDWLTIRRYGDELGLLLA